MRSDRRAGVWDPSMKIWSRTLVPTLVLAAAVAANEPPPQAEPQATGATNERAAVERAPSRAGLAAAGEAPRRARHPAVALCDHPIAELGKQASREEFQGRRICDRNLAPGVTLVW